MDYEQPTDDYDTTHVAIMTVEREWKARGKPLPLTLDDPSYREWWSDVCLTEQLLKRSKQ